eukprot:gene623-1287_t
MKFLGAFNTLPDILFTWHDRSFITHLESTLTGNGYPEGFTLEDEDTKLNVISQFFSPLIASQKYMTNIGDPFSTITCENGSTVAVQNYDNLFFIALCGDGEESEWFLHKKIAAFRYLIGMLYASAIDQLKPSLSRVRQQRWKTLGSLLEAWQVLSQQEHMFLVESLERLHVNPVLNTTCLNLLEDVLSKANKEGHAVHSLLLVNNKLLGLYSIQNAPELKTSDILMLTVFLKEKFKYTDKTVPFSINRTPSQMESIKVLVSDTSSSLERKSLNSSSCESVKMTRDETNKGESPSSCVEFLSANSTPLLSQLPSTQEGYHTPHGGSPTSVDNLSEVDEHSDGDLSTPIIDELDSSNSLRSPFEGLKEAIEDECTAVENNEVETFQLSLFLRTVGCCYTPHVVDFIKIDSATVLITISESRLVGFSITLSQILDMLTIFTTQKHQRSAHQESVPNIKQYERTDALFKKLVDGIFSNQELQVKWLIDNAVLLKNQWEAVKQNGLKAHLESSAFGQEELTPKLEASLLSVKRITTAIFTFIFINQRPPRQGQVERHLRVVSNIREVASNKLSYFNSYLQVRGQRNVTMTAYNNDFPGLVHFIYINRTTNQLTAPTINQQSQVSAHSIQHLIKQKVWEMWQYAENHVSEGYASFIVRHSDFTYSYFIWFEDAMGKPLSVQRLPKVDHSKTSTGIFAGNFYRHLIRQCFPTMSFDAVHCYELFCVHIGIVSSRFVATSCKKLASQLWETSGEASSPIGLL